MAEILVADDDAVVSKVLSSMLASMGHAAHQARNGLEALAILDTTRVDLVICDLRMPLLDGASLARYLLAASSRPRLLVISRDLRAPGAAAVVQQADASLSKPLTFALLEQTVAALLEPDRRAPAGRQA